VRKQRNLNPSACFFSHHPSTQPLAPLLDTLLHPRLRQQLQLQQPSVKPMPGLSPFTHIWRKNMQQLLQSVLASQRSASESSLSSCRQQLGPRRLRRPSSGERRMCWPHRLLWFGGDLSNTTARVHTCRARVHALHAKLYTAPCCWGVCCWRRWCV